MAFQRSGKTFISWDALVEGGGGKFCALFISQTNHFHEKSFVFLYDIDLQRGYCSTALRD